MQDLYVENQTPLPYQVPTQPAPMTYQDAPEPRPPVSPRRSTGRVRTGAIVALTLLLAVVLGVGLFAGWQFGRTGNASTNTAVAQSGAGSATTAPSLTGNNIEAVREAVVAKVRPAVVQVNVSTSNGSALGSGVIIDRRGYIVTNNHMVDGSQSIEVIIYDVTTLQAQLVGTDPADDLAVLKITPPSKGLTVATLGDSSKLQVGQEVLAIG